MDVEMPKGRSFQKGFELQIYEDDLDRLEQVSFDLLCDCRYQRLQLHVQYIGSCVNRMYLCSVFLCHGVSPVLMLVSV